MADSASDRPNGDLGAAADLLAGVFLLALAAFVGVEALRMPTRGPLGFFTGPGLVPLALGVALAIMSATLLVSSVRLGAVRVLPSWLDTLQSTESVRLAIIIGLTGLLVILIGRIPFWAANFAYFLLTFTYLRVGGRRLWVALLYAVGMTVFVGILLPMAFELPMP